METLITQIEQLAKVWCLDDNDGVSKKIVEDPMSLSCGCCISEELVNHLSNNRKNTFQCPECMSPDTYGINISKPLATISQLLLLANAKELKTKSIVTEVRNPKKNQSLLTAFQEAFSEAQKLNGDEEFESPVVATHNSNGSLLVSTEPIEIDGHTTSNVSYCSSSLQNRKMTSNVSSAASFTPPKANSVSLRRRSSLASNLSRRISISPTFNNTNESQVAITNTTRNLELLLAKNFPFYRRLYTHNLYPTFFLRTKTFIGTAISPSIKFVVLLSEKKWEVFIVNSDNPAKVPSLYCEGRSDGSYGKMDLTGMKKEAIIKMSNFSDLTNLVSEENDKHDHVFETMGLLENWEHSSCKLTDNILVIAGTRGFLRIIALNGVNPGRVLYTYHSKFPIRCFDISPNENLIAIGVTGRDKYTKVEQTVVIILRLSLGLNGDLFVNSYPFTLPYRDPLALVKFAPDSCLLSVATVLESRFMTISIKDPTRPSLLMKSQRRLDTSLDAEGLTDLAYFPDQRLMTLTSVSHTSSPIILDTNIPSVVVPDGIAKPKLIMKADEVGSLVHSCAPSPRGDAIAFLSRNGVIYVMSFSSPRLEDHSSRDSRRTVEVANVARGSRRLDAASLQWDREGYRLWAIDRIGCVTVVDWVSGTVDDINVSRCKIIG